MGTQFWEGGTHMDHVTAVQSSDWSVSQIKRPKTRVLPQIPNIISHEISIKASHGYSMCTNHVKDVNL